MKFLLIIGLFSLALIDSGCSASFEGSYKGKLEVSGIVGGQSWDDSDGDVIALVKRDGGSVKLEFADTTLFKNCKGLDEGVSCEVDVKGSTESLAVTSVVYQSREKTQGRGAVAIFVQGVTKQSKTFLSYQFGGLPYGQK